MKVAAVMLAIAGAAIGTGAALEFAYFGPGTPQFWAGVIATPAGGLMLASAAALWRASPNAATIVSVAGLAMLAATVVSTYLDVMGPPAILIGALSSLLAFVVARRSRQSRLAASTPGGVR